MRDRSRRAVLGTTGVALATALAGCNDLLGGGGGGGDGSPTSTGTPTDGAGDGTETATDTPTGTETETETVSTPPDDAEPENGPAAVDRWLTDSSVGGEASNYDEGDFADRTGEAAVEIEVGAEGNGGALAFSPAAVLISAGSEVRWEWTGDGGPHNVYADRDDQMGATDYEFRSGEPQEGANVTFVRTLNEPGVALYHCEEHLASGMKGGIVVREED